MHRIAQWQLHLGWVCLAVAALVATGCGRGDNLDRHPIRGTVTYKGQPVQEGAIFFQPTADIGQLAPTIYLKVVNGKYEVSADEGPVAGKYEAVVAAADKSKEIDDGEGGKMNPQLFPDYRTEVTIPAPNDTFDLDVPEGGTPAVAPPAPPVEPN